jgi:hypothetical protein
MDITEIESLRKKIEVINKKINEKKANVKVLKEQLTKKVQELRALGINALDEAAAKIDELENEYEMIESKVKKAIEDAESQLDTSDEIF